MDRLIKTLFCRLGPNSTSYPVCYPLFSPTFGLLSITSPTNPYQKPLDTHAHTDLGFHFFPALLLSVDYVLYSPPWTIRPFHALLLSAAIAFGYWFWVEACHARNGFYPYPIFENLDTVGRIALFSLSAGLMTASTEALKGIYWLVHGDERGVGAELRRRKVK